MQHDHAVPSAFSLRPSAFKRIAYCSPVNPVASGISDYSEELLPFLGQYADITLFVERGVVPSNEHLRRHLAIQPLELLPRLHRQHPFDAVVYHMGNSPAHGTIYELMGQIPGVVVLHDWVLHHFKLWYAAERKKNVAAYLQEMQARYGPAGERVARKMSRGQLPDQAFAMPLVEDVIERARGLIGHSQLIVERARAVKPSLAATVVPMGVPLPLLLDQTAARDVLGLPHDVSIWASFGHINPYKRIAQTLRAFAHFRGMHPNARYVLVGSVSPNYDLHALVRRLGLDAAVQITGHVPQDAFALYVAAADLCLNLRAPTAGETSASLLRLLAAGRPTLVSALDTFDELPDDVCAKVDVDRAEGALILAYAELFQQHPTIARQLGTNARRYVAEQHTLDGAAQGYIAFLSQVYGWGDVPKQRPPLWEVGNREQGTGNREQITGTQRVRGEQGIRNKEQHAAPAFSLQPSAFSLSAVAQAAAELGVRADDTPLHDVARSIGDLFG
jgi:glycosyltransferase involved in cell wall biosynthesis